MPWTLALGALALGALIYTRATPQNTGEDDDMAERPQTIDQARLTLARTLWGEARGEGARGMRAVAAVVMNRVRDPRWPDNVAAVCQQHSEEGVYQFSAWSPDNPNRTKMLQQEPGRGNRAFQQAWEIAGRTLDGTLEDPTRGATHYIADYIEPPWWTANLTQTANVGRHVFYA